MTRCRDLCSKHKLQENFLEKYFNHKEITGTKLDKAKKKKLLDMWIKKKQTLKERHEILKDLKDQYTGMVLRGDKKSSQKPGSKNLDLFLMFEEEQVKKTANKAREKLLVVDKMIADILVDARRIEEAIRQIYAK